MSPERNFPADLLMLSEIAVDRSWETPLDSTASRVTPSDIVPPRSSDGFLNAKRILVTVSEGATASEKNAAVFLVRSTKSDIREEMFSEIPLAPLKTLATESATVGLSVIVLNPVKSLVTASEIVGLSDDALNPLKEVVARSEGATASEKNTMLFLVWSTRSDISEEMFSEIPLAPLKTLLAASEIGGTSDRDLATPLFTTSEIADARFPDVVLNPVKALDVASEMVGVSASERATA